MGLCKSRQTPAAAAKQFANKAEYHKMDTSEAKAGGKSWARLRAEAPLNPTAEAFLPQSQKGVMEIKAPVRKGPRSRLPAGRLQTQSVALPDDNRLSAKLEREQHSQGSGRSKLDKLPSASADDPEWMQALAKRLAGSTSANSSPQVQPPELQPQPGVDLGSGPAPGFVLRTDEYMQLLQGSNNGRARGRDGLKVMGGAQWPEKPALAVDTALAAPARLGQLWTNALMAPTLKSLSMDVNSADVEAAAGFFCTTRRSFRDDTFIEQFLDDRDSSEQAYWSDGGDGTFPAPHGRSALVPSAHRFRVGAEQPNRALRSYVMQDLSDSLDQAVALLLGRLRCYEQQHKSFDALLGSVRGMNPQRRFFIGLKEVFRRLKQGHVKALIVAPHLDATSTLDDRMRDVLGYSYQHEVPVIFALSRKRIGQAIGKNLNVSILGIVDVTGARKLCDAALNLAMEQRLAWLDRAEREQQSLTAPRM